MYFLNKTIDMQKTGSTSCDALGLFERLYINLDVDLARDRLWRETSFSICKNNGQMCGRPCTVSQTWLHRHPIYGKDFPVREPLCLSNTLFITAVPSRRAVMSIHQPAHFRGLSVDQYSEKIPRVRLNDVIVTERAPQTLPKKTIFKSPQPRPHLQQCHHEQSSHEMSSGAESLVILQESVNVSDDVFNRRQRYQIL
jgi:hypothetical protein